MLAKQMVNTRDGYNLWSRYYDQDKNVLVELDPPSYAKRIESILSLQKNNTALDACCGSGRHLRNLETYFSHVHGVDSSNQMLNLAAAKITTSTSKLYCDNFLNFKPETSYDFINCSLALMHFPNLENFFKKIVSLLSDEGTLYLTDAPKKFLDNGFFPRVENEGSKITIEHFVYNLDEVKNAALKAGLDITGWGYIPLNETLLDQDSYFEKYKGQAPLYYIVAKKVAHK